MARRQIEVFSLSFLDCISCGFGAVVLLFVIINSQVAVRADEATLDLVSETTRIEQEVLDGRKNLVRLRSELKEEDVESRTIALEMSRLEALLKRLREGITRTETDSLARKASIERLKADIKQLSEANERLSARASPPTTATGQRVRSFVGEGNRQYLTGLKVGGKRVLVLVDTSTSMLGRNYVNVLRFRSMTEAGRLEAPKWRQVVKTVDWITTQIPPGSQFQIYAFSETAHSLIDGSDGKWLQANDSVELTRAINNLRKTVPAKGTSLINAFSVASTLAPSPDIIYLITDGLPTVGEKAPSNVEQIDPGKRRALFDKARRALSGRTPVNVLLFPMDGDPDAPYLFWELAVSSGGALLSPSEDWP